MKRYELRDVVDGAQPIRDASEELSPAEAGSASSLVAVGSGINFAHQYGLGVHLEFVDANDIAAQETLQSVLTSLDHTLLTKRPDPDLSMRIISYAFDGQYTVDDGSGTERYMSFCDEGDVLGDRRTGPSRYSIGLTMDFEADTDLEARGLVSRFIVPMTAIAGEYERNGLTIKPVSLLGYEFEGVRRKIELPTIDLPTTIAISDFDIDL